MGFATRSSVAWTKKKFKLRLKYGTKKCKKKFGHNLNGENAS